MKTIFGDRCGAAATLDDIVLKKQRKKTGMKNDEMTKRRITGSSLNQSKVVSSTDSILYSPSRAPQ
tara:strand:- start:81879 stop:82076 length:198 start_codon:yes stop_codon:yes gene_type:complete